MAATSRTDGSGVEVIVEMLDDPDRPQCPHGPTILFERYCNGRFRRFYACSSCRDRKQCDFYQAEDDKVSDVAAKARKEASSIYMKQSSKYKYSRLGNARKNPEERKFCRQCHILFTGDEADEHKDHPCFENITEEQLEKPTCLLTPLENNKSNAQYLFSEKTTQFMTEMIDSLEFTHVLCIGTPTIHENIVHQKTMLLDIDSRLGQFFPASSFCHYNMFNHHFFGGTKARTNYEEFLSEAVEGKLGVFIDPPFGGLVDLIDHTLSLITSDWRKAQPEGKPNDETDLSIFWIFPYFLETRVCQKRSSLQMLDYKVDYLNHEAFRDGPKGRKHGSPVRIFTDVLLKKILLPEEDGYRYCEKCERYVAQENEHCRACKCCPSKDGSSYIHCDACEKCVKPSRTHCFKCEACLPPGHTCGAKTGAGCFICGDLTHKRSDCPQKKAARKGKRVIRRDPSPTTVPRKIHKSEKSSTKTGQQPGGRNKKKSKN